MVKDLIIYSFKCTICYNSTYSMMDEELKQRTANNNDSKTIPSPNVNEPLH